MRVTSKAATSLLLWAALGVPMLAKADTVYLESLGDPEISPMYYTYVGGTNVVIQNTSLGYVPMAGSVVIENYGGSITINSPISGYGDDGADGRNGRTDPLNPSPTPGAPGVGGFNLTLRALKFTSQHLTLRGNVTINAGIDLSGGDGGNGGNGGAGLVGEPYPNCGQGMEGPQNGEWGAQGGPGGVLVIEGCKNITVSAGVTILTTGGSAGYGGLGGNGVPVMIPPPPPPLEDPTPLMRKGAIGAAGGAGAFAGAISFRHISGATSADSITIGGTLIADGGAGGSGGAGGLGWPPGVSGLGVSGGRGGSIDVASLGTASVATIRSRGGQSGNGASGAGSGNEQGPVCWDPLDPVPPVISAEPGGSGATANTLTANGGAVTVTAVVTIQGSPTIETNGGMGGNAGRGGAGGMDCHCPIGPSTRGGNGGIAGGGGVAGTTKLMVTGGSGYINGLSVLITCRGANGGNGANGGESPSVCGCGGCPGNGSAGAGGGKGGGVVISAPTVQNLSGAVDTSGGNGGDGGSGESGGMGGLGGQPGSITIPGGSSITTTSLTGQNGNGGTNLDCPELPTSCTNPEPCP